MSPPSGNGTAQAPLARNDYREGQVLHARDLERESGFFQARGRQHAALLHGSGIVQGLALTAVEAGTDRAATPEALKKAHDDGQPLSIDLFVSSGVAVDAYGRLVVVPRREPVSTELARSPSPARRGTLRVELLYQRTGEAAAGAGAGPCGGNGSGGGRLLREGYRLRAVPADDPVLPPAGSVLDGPPDAPEAEAPVVLGTVEWNPATVAYTGYSPAGRVYVPVHAQRVVTPDGQMELELTDGATLGVASAGSGGPFTTRFCVDAEGAVWAQGGMVLGPEGVTLRAELNDATPPAWSATLWRKNGGAVFDAKLEKYAPGDAELRVVLDRGDEPVGKRRIVLGHMQGDEMRPAVVVYDQTPASAEPHEHVVEVWGDLYVRGIVHVKGLEGLSVSDDDVSRLLAQLAGPMGGILRAYLISSSEYVNAMRDHLVKDEQFVTNVGTMLVNNQAFITNFVMELAEEDTLVGYVRAVRDWLLKDDGFIAAVGSGLVVNQAFVTNFVLKLAEKDTLAGYVTAVRDWLLKDDDFMTAVGTGLVVNQAFVTNLVLKLAEPATLAGYVRAVRDWLVKDDGFITDVGTRLLVNQKFIDGLIRRLAESLVQDPQFVAGLAGKLTTDQRTVIGKAVVDHIGSTAAARNAIVTAVTTAVTNSETLRTSLRNALQLPSGLGPVQTGEGQGNA